MRNRLLALALVCAAALSPIAGEMPGAPLPPPEDPPSAAASASYFIVWIEGVPFIVYY